MAGEQPIKITGVRNDTVADVTGKNELKVTPSVNGEVISSSNPLSVEIVSGATPANINLETVGGDPIVLGQTTAANSVPTVLATDQTLPLPTGASTSALQTTGNTSIASIDSKTPPPGQALMAASMPVAIASNQSWIGALNLGKQEEATHVTGDVGVASLFLRSDSPASSSTATGRYTLPIVDNLGRTWVNTAYANTIDQSHTHSRQTALTGTAVAIKASAGNLYGLNIININTVPVYIKFYNTAQGSTTVGTTAIVDMYLVPASDGTTPGSLVITPDESALYYFSTAITVACVTGLADNSTAAPATAIYAKFIYK